MDALEEHALMTLSRQGSHSRLWEISVLSHRCLRLQHFPCVTEQTLGMAGVLRSTRFRDHRLTYHKANSTTMFVALGLNEIGDDGASAFADALEATLLMC